MNGGSTDALSRDDAEWLDSVRAAGSLEDLRRLTGADTTDEAYFAAKHRWYRLRDVELPPPDVSGLPGDTVEVDGRRFHVHGVTHSGSREEREFVRRHVDGFVDAGDAVYCEQGLWRIYFSDVPEVHETDDYGWAGERCRSDDVCDRLDDELSDVLARGFDAVAGEAEDAFDGVRSRLFSAVDAGEALYGERVADAVGDSLSCLLSDSTALARGDDFQAFRLSRAAADDPSRLGELQRYYHRRFLPQPLEREWLWSHAPEVEVFTHARNERIADFAVYDAESPEIHVVVGAAHQPGVTYYLERHAEGERSVDDFEPLG
ncbi:MAG: hypothetical protein ACLFMT_07805 [Halobacteriales archaeon]